MKQIRKRLTYANVMSSLAVFLILGGATAFAATKITAKQLQANSVTTAKIKKSSVTASKIKDNAITTSKIADNAVTTGKIADNAVTGAKVDESTLGQVPSAVSADSANPVAFAKINQDGTVDGVNTKGLTNANITHPSAGTYCVTVPAFTPRGAQATPQFGGTYGETTDVSVGGTGFCPAPAVQILTIAPGTPDTPSNLTFYVELYH